MQVQDFAPQRHVTRVYRRKQKSQTTSVSDDRKSPEPAKSLLIPASSNSQVGDELFTRSPSNRSSLRCTTPPSTPRRKRTIGSQALGPSKSPSKIKVDKELGLLFSPNGKLPKAAPSSDLEELTKAEKGSNFEDETTLDPSSSRMRARPARKLARWQSSEKIILEAVPNAKETSSRFENVAIKVEETAFDQFGQPMPQGVNLIKGQQRLYSKVTTPMQPRKEAQLHLPVLRHPLPARPSWDVFNQRWAEMDDLDSDEIPENHSSLTKGITGLRDSGQDRQQKEDFDYLVIDLKPEQSLSVRRGTCVELCKRILKDGKEDDSGGSRGTSGYAPIEVDSSSPVASSLDSIGVFLKYMQKNGLIGTLWRQMRLAGAGKGNDEALDLALVLICAKLSTCDPTLLQLLALQDDFYAFLVDCLQVRQYSGKTNGKEKKVKPLLDLAGCQDDEKQWINEVALEILAAAVDLPNYFKSHVPLDIRKEHSGTNASRELWIKIAAERQKIESLGSSRFVSGHKEPNYRDLYFIGQIMSDCIDEVESKNLLVGSIEDLIALLRFIFSNLYSEDLPEGKGREEVLLALCALLKMSVAMVSRTDYDWRAEFLGSESFLEFVMDSIIRSAIDLLGKSEEVHKGSREIFTLFLALLTDLVNVKIAEIRSLFLLNSELSTLDSNSNNKATIQGKRVDRVHLLGHLLLKERNMADVDADAGYTCGSLAVLMALLIVGNPESIKDAHIPTQLENDEVNTITQSLSKGLECDSVFNSIQMLISIIEDFSSTVQEATKTLRAMIAKLKTSEEMEEDQHFFRYLITSLRIVADSASL